ncbi:MAG TPA: 3' terminal RNA ribose 2'-O-methyltransferase Hen1 [Gemmatimonadales bacterium]
MILEISTTHRPATDLGYLLHKNPARAHSFDLPFGTGHVFYPVATADLCTAALLLDIDPIGLVRRPGRAVGMAQEYVNDRPYVASSFLSVAISRIYGSAMGGRTSDRPELAEQTLPLHARLAAIPCRGGETLLRRLFEPLGYHVLAQPHVLDTELPQLGSSVYFTIELSATCRLRELLTHLYVLIPVLDTEKHYWIGDAEVDKLLRHGEGWLANHPERELITRRYLRYAPLVRQALVQLIEEDEPAFEEREEARGHDEKTLEDKVRLRDHRIGAVLAALRESGAHRVVDLGCGEGALLQVLMKEPTFHAILGVDVSHRALEIAARRLHLDTLPPKQRERINLLHSSLMYRDRRLEGYDAAAVIEVIEHLDAARLAAFERAVFECARPRTVVVTTPNFEYNVRFVTLPAGVFRHADHRFEWTREQFQSWSRDVAQRFGYQVRFLPVGPEDPEVGAPTQMGIFVHA